MIVLSVISKVFQTHSLFYFLCTVHVREELVSSPSTFKTMSIHRCSLFQCLQQGNHQRYQSVLYQTMSVYFIRKMYSLALQYKSFGMCIAFLNTTSSYNSLTKKISTESNGRLDHKNTRNLPFLFQVKVSLSFCPSISMSSLIGTRTSGIDAAS